MDEARKELAEHALLAVGTEDGRIWARQDVEWIECPAFEVFALIVAGQNRTGWQTR